MTPDIDAEPNQDPIELIEGGYYWVLFSGEWDVAKYIGGQDKVFWLTSFNPGVTLIEHIERIGSFIAIAPPEAQQ